MRFTTRTWAAMAAVAAAVAAAAAAVQPATASEGAVVDHGTLVQLNHSNVHGVVTLVERAGQLRVNLNAHGLEPGQLHMQHIHGFGNGTQAHCPDMSLAGADGVLSFAEGLPAYGPVVITLGRDVTAGSHVAYSRTFTSTDAGAPETSLGDFDQYVIVVHGLTNAGSFDPSLPVACAVLTAH
ncbi:MAG: hypothetical protein IRY92_13100 [Dactylosporangium sp.]|jgi:hypothetical protein|nr:hypothetical protein [Dactylosporangium sp.]